MATYRVDLRERDIDVFGHVHYAEYLVFCAQARNGWLRDAGITRPGDHVVARIEVDYRCAAKLADRSVMIDVAVLEVGRSSLTLRELVRTREGELLVEVRSVVVRYHPGERRAEQWTLQERDQLLALVG